MTSLMEALSRLKTDDLRTTARYLEQLKKGIADTGPQNDDQLHAWIKENLAYDIPRVRVCEDHSTPFDFLSDLYFNRVNSAVAMANRGGSKTMVSALLHFLNSMFKPGFESMSVGAIEAQSKRAYENLRKIIMRHGNVKEVGKHPMVIRSIESETSFQNGSKVEIVPGTVAAVNGPHPNGVHADEVELMDPSVFQESRNMSQSKDGHPAVDWITSTRKRAAGPMQQILDKIAGAEAEGRRPPYKLYVWCVFESAKNVPNCQIANPGLPAEERCECDQIANGKWEDGTQRRFIDVCKGKLSRSQGFIELADLHKTFMESDQDTWEAQQECSKPEVGGMVFKTWNKERYGIKWYDPKPEYGDVYMSVDWGTDNPAGVTWYQHLNRDLLVHGFNDVRGNPTKVLNSGTYVAFDEIYKARMGNTELGKMVQNREESWREIHPEFQIRRRFADPANLGARADWVNLRMPTSFFCTRDIKEQIKSANHILKADMFAVDIIRCKVMPLEFDAYHYPEKKAGMVDDPETPVDDFNHIMSNFRYFVENMKYILRRQSTKVKKPRAGSARYTKSPVKSGAPRYLPTSASSRLDDPVDLT